MTCEKGLGPKLATLVALMKHYFFSFVHLRDVPEQEASFYSFCVAQTLPNASGPPHREPG